MATHSSILICRIPWTEPGEPGRLQSMGRKESDMIERLSIHVESRKMVQKSPVNFYTHHSL